MTRSANVEVLLVANSDYGRTLRDFLRGIRDLSLVDQVKSSWDAILKLQEKHVDVVVIDLSSQNIHGPELTREIRNVHRKVRVLVTTASHAPSDIFAAMDAGADGYVLKGNHQGLEHAVRSVKLGTVWLDPGIAAQVVETIVTASNATYHSRTIPTGLMVIPLLPQERKLLDEVAAGDCSDGVCMVDPSFLAKLKRYKHAAS